MKISVLDQSRLLRFLGTAVKAVIVLYLGIGLVLWPT